MDNPKNDRRFYLTHIADRWGRNGNNDEVLKEILYDLINCGARIYAPLYNVTFTSGNTGFSHYFHTTDVELCESYLQVIYTAGSWTDDYMFTKFTEENRNIPTEAIFDDKVTITKDSLCTPEYELERIEKEHPELLRKAIPQEDKQSAVEEDNPQIASNTPLPSKAQKPHKVKTKIYNVYSNWWQGKTIEEAYVYMKNKKCPKEVIIKVLTGCFDGATQLKVGALFYDNPDSVENSSITRMVRNRLKSEKFKINYIDKMK
jgi:hypothetical protein